MILKKFSILEHPGISLFVADFTKLLKNKDIYLVSLLIFLAIFTIYNNIILAITLFFGPFQLNGFPDFVAFYSVSRFPADLIYNYTSQKLYSSFTLGGYTNLTFRSIPLLYYYYSLLPLGYIKAHVINFLMQVSFIFISLKLLNVKYKYILAVLFSNIVLSGLGHGQVLGFLTFFIVSSLLFLADKKPFLAGFILSLVVLKPQYYLIVTTFCLLLFFSKNYCYLLRKFVLGWFVGGSFIYLICSLIYGSLFWAYPFLNHVFLTQGSLGGVRGIAATSFFLNISDSVGEFFALYLTIIFSCLVFFKLLLSLKENSFSLFDLMMFALVLFYFVSPHANHYDFAPLLVLLAFLVNIGKFNAVWFLLYIVFYYFSLLFNEYITFVIHALFSLAVLYFYPLGRLKPSNMLKYLYE
jgi:hypothetical protein